jgi:hypothetical protein
VVTFALGRDSQGKAGRSLGCENRQGSPSAAVVNLQRMGGEIHFKVLTALSMSCSCKGWGPCTGLTASLVHATRVCMRSQHTAFQLAESAHVLTAGSVLWGLRLNAFSAASLRLYQTPPGRNYDPLGDLCITVVRPAKASTFVICLKHHQRIGDADSPSTSKTAQRPPRTTDMQA